MAENSRALYNVVKCEIVENPCVEELNPDDLSKD